MAGNAIRFCVILSYVTWFDILLLRDDDDGDAHDLESGEDAVMKSLMLIVRQRLKLIRITVSIVYPCDLLEIRLTD
ncbi:Hypothetical predicted protein [Octopus vulgaris]|uniref:Uncharacterized protein n=1 Tax=Octopus vulgaris TaxID=6645 RepID=A0AA36BLT4_OCTVU|nr:Hypothetical predicted protein [Octopus vulgaris]